jgi:Zn-dependent alcohol dehydrogenase
LIKSAPCLILVGRRCAELRLGGPTISPYYEQSVFPYLRSAVSIPWRSRCRACERYRSIAPTVLLKWSSAMSQSLRPGTSASGSRLVCHSDSFTKQGAFPGIQYPRVPGHEVVGIVDAVGTDVPDWKPGQRVGVGWHGGHCGHCRSCRRGDFITCENGQIPGISYDGGYADYMIAPFEALASVPAELAAEDAAPLLCAGITTFNALRKSGVRAGDLVAVLGIGGLGHLGVQFAAKMGCHTVAIARSR